MSAGSRAGALTPKQPAWAIVTLVSALVVLFVYVALAWSAPWEPGRAGGLVAGTAAAALFVNAALYPVRRRWGVWPLPTAQHWLQLHLYGSLLGAVLVLVHLGFRWPAGTFGWLLSALTVWTGLTGAAGVYLQKALPAALARNLKVEAIYERIPALIEQLVRDSDAVMVGAPEVMTRVYRSDVRPVLQRPMPRWSYVMDMGGGAGRQSELLSRIGRYVEGIERDRIVALEGIVNDKFDLDVHLSVQRALRTWLVIHVPPAMALMGLMVVHLFAVLYF